MESITTYFTTIPSSHRAIILFGGLAVFFMIENALPLFTAAYDKKKHTGINIFFTLTTVVVNLGMAFILAGAAYVVTEYNFGLLNWIGANVWVELILGLLLLDFIGSWLAHYIEHHVTWMWQFHVIHHTDQNVDTTTANRHHPGESVIRFIFTTVAVLLIGAPMWLVFLYQSLSVVLTQFNHSNVKMNENVDRVLRLVFCTPNMHRVHHHYRQPYSDTNYGNIFSFWDRLFGTYVVVDNSKLVYGVDTYMDKQQTENILDLLKIPFQGHQPHIEYEEEERL
jgi:sterol desaturase/sphingolipid hydroxylase (fatty acid hydroxylase superfamily)